MTNISATRGEVTVPDLIEPITAYKLLDFYKGKLYSPAGRVEAVWEPFVTVTAECDLPSCKSSPSKPRGGFDEFMMVSFKVDTQEYKRYKEWLNNRHLYGEGCGIYGYKDPATLHLQEYTSKGIPVMTTVQLWGTIYEYELGWRAQHGRGIAASCPPNDKVKGCRRINRELAKLFST